MQKQVYSLQNSCKIERPGKSGNRFLTVIFAMLIAPPFLLIEAWRTTSAVYRHWLLTAFFVVYGSTIGITYDPTGAGGGVDGVHHLKMVHVHYVDISLSDFLRELWEIISLQVGTSASKDVYIHVVSYLVGGVIGIPALFFVVIGGIYGYFFSGSMLIIFQNLGKTRLPLVTLFLIANFFLIKNIEGVNTVRTWTGLWVLVYGSLQYYRTRRMRYLVLMMMPPFFHVGYFIMALPAYIVVLFGSRVFLYAVLFTLSSTTTFINSSAFLETTAKTQRGEEMAQGYYREDILTADQVVAKNADARVWKLLERLNVQRWALNVFIFTLFFCGLFTLKMNSFEQWTGSIGLLMLTLSNSLWFMYAIHNRAWIIGAVFIGAAFIMMRLRQTNGFNVPRQKLVYNVGLAGSALLFMPYFLFNLSTLLDFLSFFILGAPFTVWLDPSLNLTIKEALRVLTYSVI